MAPHGAAWDYFRADHYCWLVTTGSILVYSGAGVFYKGRWFPCGAVMFFV